MSPNDPADAHLKSPPQPLPAVPSAPKTSEVAAQASHDNQVSLECGGPEMNEMAKQSFLWQTHGYLSEYARFGDTKAGFAGAISAALLGALYSAKSHIPLLQMPYYQWPMATWLAAVSSVFLVASIFLAIWTVLPRLRSTDSKGFIFWGSIAAHRTVETLQTSFHGQSARTLNDHLLHQIFDVASKVCIPKYRAVSLCIWALVIGGFLAMAALVLRDIPGQGVSASTPAKTLPVISSEKIDSTRP